MEPGIYGHPITHNGRSVHSPEEVDRVLQLAIGAMGQQWTDEDGTRTLGQNDILVVAPYNRQVTAIRAALDRNGLNGVAVGTVDKLQGQEAPVVIVSLTASSANEIPRGIDFLLLRNRLNVAVSRAQWACHLVYSPGLVGGSINSVEGTRAGCGAVDIGGQGGLEHLRDLKYVVSIKRR